MKRIGTILAVMLVIALILVIAVAVSGNNITTACVVVTDSGCVYMDYGNRPVRLNGDIPKNLKTGDTCIIIFSRAFAQSYPEQTNAFLVVKIRNGTPDNISSGTLEIFDSLTVDFEEIPPYDAMLNLQVMDGLFRFQRIAVTPCIVYSDTPITDMAKGTEYADDHDLLLTLFRATDGKKAVTDTSERVFSHYLYLYDNEHEDIPWQYRFAICDDGTVLITNHDDVICTIQLSEKEIQSVLDALK